MSESYPALKQIYPEHFEPEEDPGHLPRAFHQDVEEVLKVEAHFSAPIFAWNGQTPGAELRRILDLANQDPQQALTDAEELLSKGRAIIPGQPSWEIVKAAESRFGLDAGPGAYTAVLARRKSPKLDLRPMKQAIPVGLLAGVAFANLELARLGEGRAPEEQILSRVEKAVGVRTEKLAKQAEKSAKALAGTENALLETRSHLEQLKKDSDKELEALKGFAASAESKIKESTQTLETRIENASKDVESLLKETRNKAKKIREAILIKEPVTYWEGRSSNSGWFALLYLALTGVGLYGCGWLVLWTWLATTEAEMVLSIQQGAAVAAAFLLCAWFVRFFSKLFLAKAHAKEDADERVAMIKTYLALTSEDEKVLEQRALMLQSIFRPGGTGLLGADPLPPGVQGVIQALIAKLGGK